MGVSSPGAYGPAGIKRHSDVSYQTASGQATAKARRMRDAISVTGTS
jgi:hypothetical protein